MNLAVGPTKKLKFTQVDEWYQLHGCHYSPV